MSSNSVFVLDANIFISAHREYYAFDIAPGFWEGLKVHAMAGKIISIDRVYKELCRGFDPKKPDEADLLTKWAMDEFAEYFVKTDTQTSLDEYGKLISWVISHNHYPPHVKEAFAKVELADSWLVAYAMAENAVVVTNEKASNTKAKVPIPALCHEFGVTHINTFELLRQLGIKLN